MVSKLLLRAQRVPLAWPAGRCAVQHKYHPTGPRRSAGTQHSRPGWQFFMFSCTAACPGRYPSDTLSEY